MEKSQQVWKNHKRLHIGVEHLSWALEDYSYNFNSGALLRLSHKKGKLHEQSSQGGKTGGLRKNHRVFQEGGSTPSVTGGRGDTRRAKQKLCSLT